jgi:hypothetical protein
MHAADLLEANPRRNLRAELADQRDRGVEAARLMARILRRNARPTQAAAYPPLAINIELESDAAPPKRDE